jgi:hypothetical protein
MVGKLHKSWPGGHVYMLVAVDKFTKWVEAAPVTTQVSAVAISFIKSIVFHFGVPYSIITDNGTNFTSKEFKSYCKGLGIKLKFASVAHPKTNRQVKKANDLICNGIKKRLLAPLEKAKSAWVDELPSVLWSLRTTPNAATQETPFFLVHGAEAVLPVEVTHEAPRVTVMRPSRWCMKLNDRPVGKPQEKVLMNIAAGFPSVKKPRLCRSGEKQTIMTEGDAC